jgi:hypothetical protein
MVSPGLALVLVPCFCFLSLSSTSCLLLLLFPSGVVDCWLFAPWSWFCCSSLLCRHVAFPLFVLCFVVMCSQCVLKCWIICCDLVVTVLCSFNFSGLFSLVVCWPNHRGDSRWIRSEQGEHN